MDINKILDTAPAFKAREAEVAEGLRMLWQKEKEVLRHIVARKYLTFKAENPKTSVNELNCMVDIDTDVHANRMECVKLESDFRKKEVEIMRIDDKFTGAKVMARLRMKEANL